ncbi:hypothetical protein MNB_SV-15-127 [hydrothermal vent metagenome]|uniref:DUF3131 domain-containing protein n=1 Tax=hydrothermal vent metagenome TaxID=652676 RepID=A0A1W1EL29_9ZZZZ
MKNILSIIIAILLIILIILGLFGFNKLYNLASIKLSTPQVITLCCDKNKTKKIEEFSDEESQICPLKSIPTEEELKMAKISWKYIENNFIKKTGLMSAADKYPSASVWDWANGVYAIFAAKKFKLITQEKYEEMMNRFLTTMQDMKLFNNELPNKTYNTISAKMTDYGNKPTPDGIGWSAADLARLLASLNVIEQCEPSLAPQIEKLTLRYRYCRILSVDGDLYGGSYKNGELKIGHETLTGYEEYLARSFELWGHDAGEARRYKFLKEELVYGVKVPTDTRKFYSNFVGSESYWYTGFDYGVDDNESGKYIKNIYKVQEERYNHTGQFTAVTEDHIDRPPYFLYNTIFTNGEAFKIINHDAQDYNDFKSVSTKAAIGMKYLFDTPYANKIFNYVKNNYDAKKGYYAGIYETMAGQNKALTLNTNSIILESLLFSKIGNLQELKKIKSRGTYDYYRNNVNNFKCLPTKEKMIVLEPYTPNNKEQNSSEIAEDLKDATIAWKYFENNYNEKTGIVNASNSYKVIKVDAIGKTIMATISARKLNIISEDIFIERINKIMETIKGLKLYNDELPNRYYDASTGEAINSKGWDLYSIAHMITGLYYLQRDYPKYKNDIFTIITKYDFSRALKDGMKNYSSNDKGDEWSKSVADPAKEYYIHNALKLFNIYSYSHFVDERNLDYRAIYGYEIPFGFYYGVANGESYLWSMMEHPYYLKYKHYSSNIYFALKERYMRTNKISTSTEEHLDKAPYWIQNTIYHNKRDWSDFDKSDNNLPKLKLVSTKASFIYNALYGYIDDYARFLKDYTKKFYKDDYGWFGGYYSDSKRVNKSLNILTNSAVLESIYYKKVGNLYYNQKDKLADKIAIHHIDLSNRFSLESKKIELFYYSTELLNKFKDIDDVIRVERKDEDFVVRIGDFQTKEEAISYLSKHKKEMKDFKVVNIDIDSSKFLFSNRYYKYDYRFPYKNRVIDEENLEFKKFLETPKAKKIIEDRELKKEEKKRLKEEAKIKKEQEKLKEKESKNKKEEFKKKD